MARKYKPISCSNSDIIKLKELSSDRENPRLEMRALMVLRCIEGEQIKDIAADLHERPNTVILWKNRFSANGITGTQVIQLKRQMTSLLHVVKSIMK